MISKYQQKTTEEVTYSDEFQCHKCGEWALISYDRCKEIVDENFEDRIIVYCPYCGTKHRIHL